MEDPVDLLARLRFTAFESALGRRIIEMHVWAVEAGLRGASAYDLFDGYCQRLVIHGAPLWRAHTSMETLHPQWNGYGYTWRRDLNAIEPEHYAHGDLDAAIWVNSPFYALIEQARAGGQSRFIRRRIEAGPEQRDFPILEEFFGLGATDYVAHLVIYGEDGERSRRTGIVYSFTADRKGGFGEDDLTLLEATLPALSLAMKSHAGHVIASGLLETYLGQDAGRRVHSGAVTRGSVEKLHAVIWYADIRGFTPISDVTPGPIVIDLLNDVFEILTGTLRQRSGQVLKFIGDALLATFSFEKPNGADACRRALEAALEAKQKLAAFNGERSAAGLPSVPVDLALHVGEVFYGNVGAIDRLDFTVIGRAVNEAARIEALCEPLGESILVSREFAAIAADGGSPLKSLGWHVLRGVREPKELFAVDGSDDVRQAGPGQAAEA
jgi:adenylate cyclase